MAINKYIEIYATVNPCDKPLDHALSFKNRRSISNKFK